MSQQLNMDRRTRGGLESFTDPDLGGVAKTPKSQLAHYIPSVPSLINKLLVVTFSSRPFLAIIHLAASVPERNTRTYPPYMSAEQF